MHPVNLISAALRNYDKELPALPKTPVTAICAVTGQECLCLPRQEVLGKTFTNHDLIAAPESKFVGVDVFWAWEYGYKTAEDKKRDKRPERMSSWFCDGKTFKELDRSGVREKVFQNEMPAIWIGYATTSYKKHGSLRAKINTGTNRFWLFEERQVDCSDMEKVKEWWDVLNAALRAGIGRSVMESLDCPPYVIGKVGLKTWMEFEQWARPRYLSALYAFLCYLLPSQEELKHENTRA